MKLEYCIVSAGLGTRFQPLSTFASKGLAPVPFKPLIGHLIEQIPLNSKIHLCVGYLEDDLKEILNLLYPTRDITFYSNPQFASTGMGDSLIPVLSEVDNPLIVMPNDGLYPNGFFSDIKDSDDFLLGVSSSEKNDSGDYLRLAISDCRKLLSYSRRGFYLKSDLVHNACFTGLMYIKSPSQFLELLKSYQSPREIYDPFKSLIASNCSIKVEHLDWHDCGTYVKYKEYISWYI